jgi:signal transduction histidine kinase/FixJ family two-component response regulator
VLCRCFGGEAGGAWAVVDKCAAPRENRQVPLPNGAATSRLGLLQLQRYRRFFLAADRKQNTIALAIISAAFYLTARNDFVLLGGTATLYVALICKVLHLVVAATAARFMYRATSPRQYDLAAGVLLLATGAVVFHSSLTRLASGEAQGPLFGLGAIISVLYFVVRSLPRYCTFTAGVVTASGLLLLWNPVAVVTSIGRVTGSLALVSLNIVGIISARAFEEQRRSRFDAESHERKLRRELSAKLAELAVEKDRVEALSRARTGFFAVMSHEFRTPMNAVIGLSDVLLDMPLEQESREHVRTINDSARALLTLLNDILDFAKIDAQMLRLSPAPFDPRALLTSITEMLRPAARARSNELMLEVSPDVPQGLLGDDVRLRQVLVNLLSNAIKFTERGAVRLQLTVLPESQGDPALQFRIQDTGIGMTPEVRARLFKPFEQGDGSITRRYGGTGLGLSISRQIVLAMGGDILVESEPGQGSVFTFTLRLPVAKVWSRSASLALLKSSSTRAPLTILVVDDHPINRKVARARFGQLRYAVDLASNGKEALEAVQRKDYDVVFMDLQMPDMSGIEATERICELLSGKRMPHIIAMTASVFEEDREACKRAGMHDFVGKPIDLAHIDSVLARVAEERSAAMQTQEVEHAVAPPLSKVL